MASITKPRLIGGQPSRLGRMNEHHLLQTAHLWTPAIGWPRVPHEADTAASFLLVSRRNPLSEAGIGLLLKDRSARSAPSCQGSVCESSQPTSFDVSTSGVERAARREGSYRAL